MDKPTVREWIKFLKSFRHEPRLYHHVCYASGTVDVVNRYGAEEVFECPYYNGDFNCGYRECKHAKIRGFKELTEIEQHQNWLLDEMLTQLAHTIKEIKERLGVK